MAWILKYILFPALIFGVILFLTGFIATMIKESADDEGRLRKASAALIPLFCLIYLTSMDQSHISVFTKNVLEALTNFHVILFGIVACFQISEISRLLLHQEQKLDDNNKKHDAFDVFCCFYLSSFLIFIFYALLSKEFEKAISFSFGFVAFGAVNIALIGTEKTTWFSKSKPRTILLLLLTPGLAALGHYLYSAQPSTNGDVVKSELSHNLSSNFKTIPADWLVEKNFLPQQERDFGQYQILILDNKAMSNIWDHPNKPSNTQIVLACFNSNDVSRDQLEVIRPWIQEGTPFIVALNSSDAISDLSFDNEGIDFRKNYSISETFIGSSPFIPNSHSLKNTWAWFGNERDYTASPPHSGEITSFPISVDNNNERCTFVTEINNSRMFWINRFFIPDSIGMIEVDSVRVWKNIIDWLVKEKSINKNGELEKVKDQPPT